MFSFAATVGRRSICDGKISALSSVGSKRRYDALPSFSHTKRDQIVTNLIFAWSICQQGFAPPRSNSAIKLQQVCVRCGYLPGNTQFPSKPAPNVSIAIDSAPKADRVDSPARRVCLDPRTMGAPSAKGPCSSLLPAMSISSIVKSRLPHPWHRRRSPEAQPSRSRLTGSARH